MNNLKNIKNNSFLITGGTGSFGKTMVNSLLKIGVKEIKIFSRDEKKQDDMRKAYNNDKLQFFIGDVRDYSSIENAVKNVDYVFHAAALKQVPSCEFFPLEAVKTNIMGTNNLLDACIDNKVKKVICLSTDKAVQPINAMGLSKSLMEKVAISKSRSLKKKQTQICITRYGNVMYSRGSVIPLFVDQINKNKTLTVTNIEMTRFMMTLDDAINLVFFAFENGQNGDLFIKKSPAASILTIIKSLGILYKKKLNFKIIGSRHGEKIHETLVSKEEMISAKNYKNFFKVSLDDRNLNYEKYFSKGRINNKVQDYASNNTKQLNPVELSLKLKKTIFKKS